MSYKVTLVYETEEAAQRTYDSISTLKRELKSDLQKLDRIQTDIKNSKRILYSKPKNFRK